MSRAELVEMAKHNLAHVKAGTIEQAPGIGEVPATNYYDAERWSDEMRQVFKRLPLMLAMTAELPNPGDYKAMEAVGVPIIITRGQDGAVRAFVNSCSHRGAQLLDEGRGSAHKFTCPYHAWTYSNQGDLIAVTAQDDFGEFDKGCHSLTALPIAERAGLIWVILNPNSSLEIDQFLCRYDSLLEHFGFADWHFFDSRKLAGPNWKIAYDGYLDLYHLPILHKDSFGPQMSNQALYYSWGPHQRVSSPDPNLLKFEDQPDSQWPSDSLMSGVWTIFPHISIASFDGGGRGVMISQLFPGDTPLESYTVQNYLMQDPPDEERVALANEQFKFLEHVVRDEDYATGLKQQRALITGSKSHVMFGRNEAGGQNFHRWLDQLLAASDEELPGLFNGQNRG